MAHLRDLFLSSRFAVTRINTQPRNKRLLTHPLVRPVCPVLLACESYCPLVRLHGPTPRFHPAFPITFHHHLAHTLAKTSVAVKVTEMCPYYFHLEDKFLARAGIKPSATSEELFDCSFDDDFCPDSTLDDVDDVDSECSARIGDLNQKQSAAGTGEAENANSAAITVANSSKKRSRGLPPKGLQVEVWQRWMDSTLC